MAFVIVGVGNYLKKIFFFFLEIKQKILASAFAINCLGKYFKDLLSEVHIFDFLDDSYSVSSSQFAHVLHGNLLFLLKHKFKIQFLSSIVNTAMILLSVDDKMQFQKVVATVRCISHIKSITF